MEVIWIEEKPYIVLDGEAERTSKPGPDNYPRFSILQFVKINKFYQHVLEELELTWNLKK